MKLALKGTLASGKSAVAGELVQVGFTLVNFTDYLKRLYAEAHGLTIQEVLVNKEAHRAAIIAHGHEIGFDDNPRYVQAAVEEAGNPEQAVFDNVRYPAQMDALQAMGYRLVRLYVPRELLALRLAVYKGLTRAQAEERLEDPTEHALTGYYPGEIEVANYDRTPAATAAVIVAHVDALDALRLSRGAAA